jgi:hypothetical protein
MRCGITAGVSPVYTYGQCGKRAATASITPNAASSLHRISRRVRDRLRLRPTRRSTTQWCSAPALILVGALLCLPRPASAYSVLAHESMIDAMWDDTIAPILAARFGAADAATIAKARAYAYGGSTFTRRDES